MNDQIAAAFTHEHDNARNLCDLPTQHARPADPVLLRAFEEHDFNCVRRPHAS